MHQDRCQLRSEFETSLWSWDSDYEKIPLRTVTGDTGIDGQLSGQHQEDRKGPLQAGATAEAPGNVYSTDQPWEISEKEQRFTCVSLVGLPLG